MEEYIRLEEEKDLRNGKVYNWEIATYGKTWYDEDVYDLISIETEFPAIVFDDAFTSEVTPSYEPMVSPLNDNKIDFRISFDESYDEDYMVIYDKNLFSYKIISVNDLKTNSENNNDKVYMPSFPSPEPEVSYYNDLDFFKDIEKEFLAIVYNDALTSKSDFLTEPTVSPQHFDEFNLKDDTSLSKCDEKKQNILYFNDLFSFNVIYLDDLQLDTDNDNDKIDIEHSLGDLSIEPLPTEPSEEVDNIGRVFINMEISKILPEDPIDARTLMKKIRNYTMKNRVMYRKSYLVLLMRPRQVVAKAMYLGYYWPFMHRDARELIRACDDCQGDGAVERENRSLLRRIKTRREKGGTAWAEEVPNVLWAHQTMKKTNNGETPFSITYGIEAIIPAEIGMPTQ
uniref:Reverse transcriptase domain-containing protein n=1 Tax=Tanacetum cinerariifolium TaxID=118510 RepID=A0A6L2K6I0_TANCI|nr:hypothetical protein [Tanacetum cinerariifolium]